MCVCIKIFVVCTSKSQLIHRVFSVRGFHRMYSFGACFKGAV